MRQLKRITFMGGVGFCFMMAPVFSSAHLTTFEGQRAWVKTVPPKKQTLSFCAKKKWAALLSPLAMARPTTTCGLGILRLESKRLRELAKLGAPVPSILKETQDSLVIADAGLNLEKVIKRSDDPKRFALLMKAIESIQRLHTLETAHGRGMLKDMVINDQGHISFIDLAEDPLSHMTLAQAKGRDWLMFLFSALPFTQESQQVKLIEVVKAAMDPLTLKEFKRTIRLIKRLQFLMPVLSKWGAKDGQRAVLLVDLLLK